MSGFRRLLTFLLLCQLVGAAQPVDAKSAAKNAAKSVAPKALKTVASKKSAAAKAEIARQNSIIALARSGDLARAEKLLQQHIESAPNAWDWRTLASVQRLQGRYADVVKSLKELLKIMVLPDARFELGQALFALGKAHDAIEFLKEPCKMGKEMSPIALGMAYQMDSDVENAIAAYRRAWDLFPDKQSTWEARTWGNMLKAAPETAKLEQDYFSFATSFCTMKWQSSKMPLKVFIDESVAGDVTAERRARYRAELVRAFDEWSKASNGKITFEFVDKKEGAHIECHWPEVHASSIEAGHAEPVMDSEGIRRATVTMQTTSLNVPTPPELMHILCLHEVGHALGLCHSPDPADIMGPLTLSKGLTERDKNSLQHLYRDDVSVQPVSDSLLQYETDPQIRLKFECARLLAKGDLPEFLKTAQNAIDANPDSADAASLLNVIGIYQLKTKHPEEAEASFKKALANPNLRLADRKRILQNYAALLKFTQRDEEAAEMSEKASSVKVED